MIKRHLSMDALTVRPAASDDLLHILTLLADAGLMTGGVAENMNGFLVASEEGRLVGTAGLEVFGDAVLLRSVAVIPSARGRGLGRRLAAEALAAARRRGVRTVALLTEDAAPFFRRLGFRETSRDRLDPRLLTSTQFTDPSCSTALVMQMDLEATDMPAEATAGEEGTR